MQGKSRLHLNWDIKYIKYIFDTAAGDGIERGTAHVVGA